MSWTHPQNHPAARRRGFATLVTMFVLILVVAAIAGGGAMVLAEQRRTTETHATAELRQMLLAGAQEAAQHAGRWKGAVTAQNWDVTLPPELADASAKLTIHVEPQSDGTVTADVQAELGTEHEGQTLIYHSTGDNWALSRIDAQVH